MTSSFTESELKAFIQSPLKARGTGSALNFFGFQIMNSIRHACDQGTFAFAPFTWPTGLFVGGMGPYVPWADYTYEDPRTSVLTIPNSSQLASDGWIHETWLCSIEEDAPPHSLPPFLLGVTDHPRLKKSSSPLGAFNDETIASGFKVRKGVMVISQGRTHPNLTSEDPFDIFFPAGVLHDQIQWMKLFYPVSGTVTRHTIPGTTDINGMFFDAPHFTGTLTAPNSPPEEFFPAKTDPPKLFKTNEFQYGDFSYHNRGNPSTINVAGTMEVAVLWFFRHIADLPSFPLSFNTATDFFFVAT